jgi:hypothetical protein
MELDAKRLIQDDSAWSRGQGQDYIDESRELDEFQRRDALPEDYPERMPDAGDFQFSTRIASARIGGIREEDTYQVKRDKKRRWWRRAAVNAVLIAMWCVLFHPVLRTRQTVRQVPLLHAVIRIQSVCRRTTSLGLTLD